MTLKEFYPQYKKHKEKTCKISTVSAYMLICKNHILPQLGDYELQDISSKEAEMLKSSLEERGLSKKSEVKNYVFIYVRLSTVSFISS